MRERESRLLRNHLDSYAHVIASSALITDLEAVGVAACVPRRGIALVCDDHIINRAVHVIHLLGLVRNHKQRQVKALASMQPF